MSGIFMAVLAGLSFGLFQTFNRKASEGGRLDSLRGTFVLIGVSALVMIVIALLTSDLRLLHTAPITALLAFVVAGFIHFFIGWTLISVSQKQIGAARTGAVIGTMPLFGLVVDLLLYQERFTWQPLLGVLLVVAGVFVVSSR